MSSAGHALPVGQVVGYRVHGGNEFLETRFFGHGPDAAARWSPCPDADAEIPGYALALSNAMAVLQVSRFGERLCAPWRVRSKDDEKTAKETDPPFPPLEA